MPGPDSTLKLSEEDEARVEEIKSELAELKAKLKQNVAEIKIASAGTIAFSFLTLGTSLLAGGVTLANLSKTHQKLSADYEALKRELITLQGHADEADYVPSKGLEGLNLKSAGRALGDLGLFGRKSVSAVITTAKDIATAKKQDQEPTEDQAATHGMN